MPQALAPPLMSSQYTHAHIHGHTHILYIFTFQHFWKFVLFTLQYTHTRSLTHTPLIHTWTVSLMAEVVSSVSRPVFYSSVPMALPSQRRPMGQRCTMPWKNSCISCSELWKERANSSSSMVKIYKCAIVNLLAYSLSSDSLCGHSMLRRCGK